MTNQKKKLIKISIIYLFIGLCGLLYLFMVNKGKGIPCLFYYHFHIECIGCGATRALQAIFRLDFKSAITYHPIYTLFLYPFAFLLIFQDYIVCLINVLKHKETQSLWEFIWGLLMGNYRRV